MRNHFFYFLSLVFPLGVFGQVSNDNIENRLFLPIEKIHHSRTDSCTVEWNCLDKKLTGKCITYHNDQWFFFNSGKNQRLFVNINGQDCRDLRGVQLVILKGKPCQPETYELLDCVSLANQDDIYVELNPLSANTEYLINVDGYLEDHCQFDIQVSETPKGTPLEVTPFLEIEAKQRGKKVYFSWQLPDSLQDAFRNFKILRRTGTTARSELIETIPTSRNAYGTAANFYDFEDSLEQVQIPYHYQVIATNWEGKEVLLGRYFYVLDALTTLQTTYKTSVEVPMPEVRRKTLIRVRVLHPVTREVLILREWERKKRDKGTYTLPTYRLIQQKIKQFQVEVENLKTGEKSTHSFLLREE